MIAKTLLNVLRSPGPLCNLEQKIGLKKRVGIGLLKALDLAAAPKYPKGKLLEAVRIYLLQLLEPIMLQALQQQPGQRPLIIGLGGGAGAGKSTLADFLKIGLELKGKKVLIIGEDEFIKSPEERKALGTEWDENHLNLTAAATALQEIKADQKSITIPSYDRQSKTIIKRRLDLNNIDIVIFDGLHALSREEKLAKLGGFMDLGVFFDANIAELEIRRFHQETGKPHPRTPEQMSKHWREGNLPDLKKNIQPTKQHADFVIKLTRSWLGLAYKVEARLLPQAETAAVRDTSTRPLIESLSPPTTPIS